MKVVGIVENNIITGVVYGEVEIGGVEEKKTHTAKSALKATKRIQNARNKKIMTTRTKNK